MNAIKAVKGMNDVLPSEIREWYHVENLCRSLFNLYGFEEIRTPILEELGLFVRGVGEGTDIVEKEMYALSDRDGKELCLRPENTASVVRAVIEHHIFPQATEFKTFYIGPMFRRDRPQKGRLRQFNQIGAEVFGIGDPSADVEAMAMLWDFLQKLGIEGLALQINSLGLPDERQLYVEALRKFFTQHQSALCQDCQRRLLKNPLRILDCKEAGCAKIAAQSPEILDFLSEASLQHFGDVQKGLARLGIDYVLNKRLVRGLDYYTRTVFEIVASVGLGAQNAIAAGGRYDQLVENMGGPSTPGFGFAAGVERILLVLEEQGKLSLPRNMDLHLVHADATGRQMAEDLAYALRRKGLSVQFDLQKKSVKAQMRKADRLNAFAVIVLGENEVASQQAQIKRLQSGQTSTIDLTVEALETEIRSFVQNVVAPEENR